MGKAGGYLKNRSMQCKCRPALTRRDHQWHIAVPIHPLLPCRAVPVAQPGCPELHFQALASPLPGAYGSAVSAPLFISLPAIYFLVPLPVNHIQVRGTIEEIHG